MQEVSFGLKKLVEKEGYRHALKMYRRVFYGPVAFCNLKLFTHHEQITQNNEIFPPPQSVFNPLESHSNSLLKY